jgi:hypothetical protein
MTDSRIINNTNQPGLNRNIEGGGSDFGTLGVRNAYTNKPYNETFFNWLTLEKNSAATLTGDKDARVYIVPGNSKQGKYEFPELERQRRSIMEG